MPQCCALNCKNRGAHLFPKDSKRRKQWENALSIKNFKANNTARLCSQHFKQEDYFGKSYYTDAEPLAKFLRKTAVPSVFCFTKNTPKTPAAVQHRQRLKKRSEIKLHEDNVQPPFKKFTFIDVKTESIVTASDDERDEICETIEMALSPEPVPRAKPERSSQSTQVGHEFMYGSINRFNNDDKSIQFYTGFENYKKFHFVYSTVSPVTDKIRYYGSKVMTLTNEDQFFMTMMKLRQNKCNFELSKFFNCSTTTVSNIFVTWVNFLYQLWSRLNVWPEKELIQNYMPQHFKAYDKKPVRETPSGLLSYCSQAYVGSISDEQTVEQNGLFYMYQSDDSILADTGLSIEDMFDGENIAVKIPTFSEAKSQLPGLNKHKDKELEKHVHIEKIIRLTTFFKILKSELDRNYMPIARKIFFVCFMCCYFRESVMKPK